MAPERGADVPASRPKLSPRRQRAVSGIDRCGGLSRSTSPRSVRATSRRLLGRWSKDPFVLMLMVFALLVSPGVVFVAKIRLNRHHREGARRSFLRSQPRRQEQYRDVRSDTGKNAANTPMYMKQQQRERGGIADLTTPRSQGVTTAGRTDENVSKRLREEDGVWDGKSVVEVSRQPRRLRSSVPAKDMDASSNFDFGCKEIEPMLVGEKTLIGRGRTRDVYLVEFRGRKLAVKALREDSELTASREGGYDTGRWEAAALKTVREHRNIADLLGVCKSSSVSEFLPSRLDDLILTPRAEPLPMSSIISMALDAARGLQALHEAPGGAIVHSEIRPQHLMLDAQGRLKINHLDACAFTHLDAGLRSCSFEPRVASRADPWRSPEETAGEDTSEKADVYSMALVLYSMLALKPPYAGDKDSVAHVLGGIAPPVDASWHQGFMAIVEDMWQRDPNARPSVRRVVERLEALDKQVVVS